MNFLAPLPVFLAPSRLLLRIRGAPDVGLISAFPSRGDFASKAQEMSPMDQCCRLLDRLKD